MVIYSHYLQSKVYRALERIKAEHGGELVAEGAAGEAAGETLVAGAAAEGSVAPEAMAKAAAEGQPFTGAGPGQGPVPGEGAAQAAEGQAGASSGSAESASKTAESASEEPTEEPNENRFIIPPSVGRSPRERRLPIPMSLFSSKEAKGRRVDNNTSCINTPDNTTA